ncbi:hypothetical protein HaLaN_20325, partial [Haematococcus lacustris]
MCWLSNAGGWQKPCNKSGRGGGLAARPAAEGGGLVPRLGRQQALALRCRRRAFQMALFAADQWRQMYDTPDTPASLYEGLSGLVCLLADVMASLALPDDAGGYIPTMPGFQLP